MRHPHRAASWLGQGRSRLPAKLVLRWPPRWPWRRETVDEVEAVVKQADDRIQAYCSACRDVEAVISGRQDRSGRTDP